MTREQLEKDLLDHRQNRDQAVANANAIGGIVQYLEAKLHELDESEKSRIVVPRLVEAKR